MLKELRDLRIVSALLPDEKELTKDLLSELMRKWAICTQGLSFDLTLYWQEDWYEQVFIRTEDPNIYISESEGKRIMPVSELSELSIDRIVIGLQAGIIGKIKDLNKELVKVEERNDKISGMIAC